MPLKWGIITAGNIARTFASGLKASKTGELVATGARDRERAESLAQAWGGRAYGSYDQVLQDPEVEAVYIATPHHLHAEWTIAAALAGKAILCEKPFTLNSLEAVGALSEVDRAGVFFMEAFMYRCSPQTRKLVELLDAGAIGKVQAIDAEFSYGSSLDLVNFRTDPAIGGGGIMDVGTYCSSFCCLVAGQDPDRVDYVANLDRGYDSYGAGVLQFPNGIVAKIASGVHLPMANQAVIYGDEGNIRIEDPWKSPVGTMMTLTRYDGVPYDPRPQAEPDTAGKHGPGPSVETFSLGCTTAELYAYEADAVAEFVGHKECPYMPVADTLRNMRILDQMRLSCGLSFGGK